MINERERIKLLLNFKNKAEREAFIRDYRKWDIWKNIPELDLRFYRYLFENGAKVIVTEYNEYSARKKEFSVQKKYCLILPENDPFVETRAIGEVWHKSYTPSGCGLGVIVDYMTKNRGAI